MIPYMSSTAGWGVTYPLEHAAQVGAVRELRTSNGEALGAEHVQQISSSTPEHPAAHDPEDRVTLESAERARVEDERKKKRRDPPQPTPVQQAARRHREQMTRVREATVRFLLGAATYRPAAKQENEKPEVRSVDKEV